MADLDPYESLEAQKAFTFTQAVRAGIPTDIAREMANIFATGWEQGYNHAMMMLKEK